MFKIQFYVIFVVLFNDNYTTLMPWWSHDKGFGKSWQRAFSFYLEPTCKKARAQKMRRLDTGDDGSLRWMRILKRMVANVRLKESGWPRKAEARVPGNGWSGPSWGHTKAMTGLSSTTLIKDNQPCCVEVSPFIIKLKRAIRLGGDSKGAVWNLTFLATRRVCVCTHAWVCVWLCEHTCMWVLLPKCQWTEKLRSVRQANRVSTESLGKPSSAGRFAPWVIFVAMVNLALLELLWARGYVYSEIENSKTEPPLHHPYGNLHCYVLVPSAGSQAINYV